VKYKSKLFIKIYKVGAFSPPMKVENKKKGEK